MNIASENPLSTSLSNHPEQKTLLVVNTGDTLKRFVFQQLKRMPIKVVVLNKEKNWAANYVDEWILSDTNDHQSSIAAVSNYHSKSPLDGVITFWEDDVLLTSKIAEALKLPGIPYAVAKIARNKHDFRLFCSKHGLPTPKFIKLGSASDIDRAMSELKFPVVVKPTFGTSSAFVVRVETADQLPGTVDFIKNNISAQIESALHEGLAILVEEYIDGDEVDIDMLLQNGKVKFWSITDNHATSEPFFIETGDTFPSLLPESTQKELVDMAEMVLEKIGITDGCIHFEAKRSSEHGPVPVEVNLRLGGGFYYSFIKQAWQVDLIEHAVKIVFGEYFAKIEKPEKPKKYFAAECLIQKESGIIASLSFPEKFDKKLQVHEFEFFREVGDVVFTPPASFDYLGWITASGDNPHDAQDNLSAARKCVSYEIVPFSGLSMMGKTERKSPNSPAWLQAQEIKVSARYERVRYSDKKQQRRLKVGIACNTYNGVDGSIEAELTSVGNNIQKSLQERGYSTIFIDFNNLNDAVSILQSNKVDFVFNVGERLNNSSLLEPHIASLLDVFQIPYTGSSPSTLSLCIDKIKVKKLLTYHDIPTPKWDYAYDLDEKIREDLIYPLIVKPSNTDNSIGITQQSVVTNKQQLAEQIEKVLVELKRPVLIEEYLDGDEYDVSIMGSEVDDLRVLPLSRTVFDRMPKGMWNIYGYDSKWSETEADYKDNYVSIQRPPKNVSHKLLSLISEIALDTYTILECHDYGRVEIKLDKDCNPHVLELNPNPSINIPNCLPSVARLMGMEYGDFLEEIIALAIKRYKNRPPYYHLQPTLA